MQEVVLAVIELLKVQLPVTFIGIVVVIVLMLLF